MKCITPQPNSSLALAVHVQPRASRNRVAGLHGNALKVCVTAPPLDNRANGAVIRLLAELFGVPRSSLTIKSGSQGRSKKVLISNLSLAEAKKALSLALPNSKGPIS